MKNFFVIIFLAFFFIGCFNKGALDFNDKLVDIQNKLLDDVEKTKMDSLNPIKYFQALKLKVVFNTSLLNAAKVPEGGENYKNAMYNDFKGLEKFYDLLIKSENPDLSDDQYDDLIAEKDAQQKHLDVLDEIVLEEQKKFAKANNFRLKK
jgi:hypothetical protein